MHGSMNIKIKVKQLLVETVLIVPMANKRAFLERNPGSDRTEYLWDNQRVVEPEIELGYGISDVTESEKVPELAYNIGDRTGFKGF